VSSILQNFQQRQRIKSIVKAFSTKNGKDTLKWDQIP
jgi:hypothetical protein